MSEKMYEKYFTVEQLQNMKASTIRNLKELEEKLAFALVAFFIVGFIEVVVMIAAIIWANKFTLFLFFVGILFVALCGSLYQVILKDYKKTLDDVKGGIE